MKAPVEFLKGKVLRDHQRNFTSSLITFLMLMFLKDKDKQHGIQGLSFANTTQISL